ncbi:hexose transporter 1-like [Dermatophagoides farinae]|uniref:hexose transporter 1-like n=1 Tax=Dermatophagoides farinae TaxID=6954 RepID=UPI003F6308CF
MITVGILLATIAPFGTIREWPIENFVNYEVPDSVSALLKYNYYIPIIASIISIILVHLSYNYETPQYYVSHRRLNDARSLLKLLHNKENVDEELTEIIKSNQQANNVRRQKKSFVHGLKQSKNLRKVLLFGIFLSTFQQITGINVFITSSNLLFRLAGYTGDKPMIISLIMNAVNCLVTIPALYLIEKLGRRTLLLIGVGGMTLSILPAAIAFWFKDETNHIARTLATIGCIGFIISFAISYGPILWVYLAEIFPVEFKFQLNSICLALNWFFAVLMVYIAQYLYIRVSYSVLAVACLVAFIVLWFFMKETKGTVLGDIAETSHTKQSMEVSENI